MELKHETQSQSPACSSLRNGNFLFITYSRLHSLINDTTLCISEKEPQRAYINKGNRTSAIVHAPRTILPPFQVFHTPLV